MACLTSLPENSEAAELAFDGFNGKDRYWRTLFGLDRALVGDALSFDLFRF
jgi:hypothetical protein